MDQFEATIGKTADAEVGFGNGDDIEKRIAALAGAADGGTPPPTDPSDEKPEEPSVL